MSDTKHEAKDQDMIKQQFDQWWKKNYPHYPQETTHGFSLWEAFKAGAEWQRSQQSAQAGYVMVPVEPTPEMYKAAKGSGVIDPRVSGYCYQLMLAAAPKAEQPPVQEPVAYVCGDDNWPTVRWVVHPGDLPVGTKLYAAPQPVSDDARDAARYRWLRENWFTMNSSYHGDEIKFYLHRNRYADYSTEQLDAAIDAAMGIKGDE